MTIRVAVITIAVSAILFTGIGVGIGWALGTFNPGYYRSVFHNGQEQWFDPVSVGVGQGLTQGMTGGVIVGLILVALFVWRDTRIHRQSDSNPSYGGMSTGANATSRIGRYIGSLFFPWLSFVIGTAILMVIPYPEAAIGLWYLLLIACSVMILIQLFACIGAIAISARRRRSGVAWCFIVGCFVNLILIGKVGGH